MASFSLWQWLVIAAIVALGFGATWAIPRMRGDIARGFGAIAHPSWPTLGVLFVIALAVLAASALFNGTWAG